MDESTGKFVDGDTYLVLNIEGAGLNLVVDHLRGLDEGLFHV